MRNYRSVLSLALLLSSPLLVVPAWSSISGSSSASSTTKANPSTATNASVTLPDSALASDRSNAYYHFLLGRLDEDTAIVTGSGEEAAHAIDEYKTALTADPTSSYLASVLADLYARTGDIRQAVLAAQEVIARDPNNLDAHRLLGRVYLRSLGNATGNAAHETESVLSLAVEQYEQIVRLAPDSVEDRLILGRLYRTSNESVKAEQQFRAALQANPASEDAIITLAQLYNEQGDPTRSLAILQAVPEAQRTARINAELGDTLELKKDFPAAIAAYRRAIAADPDSLDARRGLAQNLLNTNQLSEALATYKAIAHDDPQDAQTWLHISEIERRRGHFDRALEALDQASAIVPTSIEIDYNRAVIQQLTGHYAEAVHQLQALVERSTKPDEKYSLAEANNRTIFLERLGTIQRELNQYDAAIVTFRRMIPLGAEAGPRAYQEIVETYRDAHRWAEATQAAQEASKKYPNDRGLQLTLASQLADTGQADAAIAQVQAMLNKPAKAGETANGEKREAWLALAQIYSRLHRYAEAHAALAQAMELSAKPEERGYVNFLAGAFYERQKKYEQSEAAFRKVLATDPDNATALNYLGYTLADRGVRLHEALALVRRAIALEPENGAFLDSLGWVYFKLGNYQQAETLLRKAVERDISDPTVHDHFGDLYQKTNRLKLAVAQWERALEEWKRSLPADLELDKIAKLHKKLNRARQEFASQPAANKPAN